MSIITLPAPLYGLMHQLFLTEITSIMCVILVINNVVYSGGFVSSSIETYFLLFLVNIFFLDVCEEENMSVM